MKMRLLQAQDQFGGMVMSSEYEKELHKYSKTLYAIFDEIFEFDYVSRTSRRIASKVSKNSDDGQAVSLETAVEKWINNFVYCDDKGAVSAFLDLSGIKQSFKEADAPTLEYRILTLEEKMRWCSSTLLQIEEDVFLCCNKDITNKRVAEQIIEDSKRAEERIKAVNESLETLLSNLSAGIGIFNIGEPIKAKYLNESARRIFGLSTDFLLDNHREDIWRFAPGYAEKLKEKIDYGGKQPTYLEDTSLAHKEDGRSFWLHTYSTIMRDEDDELSCYSVMLDVTEQVEMERTLAKQRELSKILIDESDLLIFDYDIQTSTMSYSVKGENGARIERRITNYLDYLPRSEVVHPDDNRLYQEILGNAAKAGCNEKVEYRADYFGKGYAWYRAYTVSLSDENGKVYRLIGRAINIEEEKSEVNRLEEKAERDALSGLLNREAAERKVNEALQQHESGRVHALLMLDIDNFKSVNDLCGHIAGDELIVQIGQILSSSFRKSDILGRIGGDEFIVFLQNLDKEERVAEKTNSILSKIRSVHVCDSGMVTFSGSVGVAITDKASISFKEMYKIADQALYKAKANGKDQFVINWI